MRALGIALDPTERRAYVTVNNGDFLVVDLTTRQVADHSYFGSFGAWGVASTHDGRKVYVANPSFDGRPHRRRRENPSRWAPMSGRSDQGVSRRRLGVSSRLHSSWKT